MAQRLNLGQLAGWRVDPRRPAIVVDSLTETFRLYHERPSGLKERLYRPRRSTYTDFNALQDVSFSVDHGESVGIVGHNGSGKSTLLKVLAKILPPDDGSVETNGMVASLLELGAGFHGDLTGRENIYLNGAILGMKRAEIEERFDEIVDFAGIRPLLDTAVRTYSSGLYVRLGFAIAVTVDPDILLVDEVLAVGDAEFQQRSLERMQQFRDAGKTFVLVSHDLDAVSQMCRRVIVLDHGRVAFDGPADDGIDLYRQRSTALAPTSPRRTSTKRALVQIDGVALTDAAGAEVAAMRPSDQVTLRVALVASGDVEACSVGVAVTRGDGTLLYEVHTAGHGVGVGPLRSGDTATVEIRLSIRLLGGHYAISTVVTDATTQQVWMVAPEAIRFSVAADGGATGLVDLAASTSVVEGPARHLDPADTPSSLSRPGSRGRRGARARRGTA
ncbi:MAG: ABC transporter ATP-binding protein [Nitriliruptoraceae bacterium]